MSYSMSSSFNVRLPHRRVLVVEDNQLVAQAIAEALERQGARVVGPVSTVTDALRLAQEMDDLDTAVLDVNLRGEMIWPVADLLKNRGVRLIFATAYATASIKERYPGADVLEKPTPARAIVRLLAD